MAVETIVKMIGGGQEFATLAAWEVAAPADYTTTEQFNADSFSGDFTQGETVTGGTSQATGKMINTNNSSYISISDRTVGTFQNGETVTGASSGHTCVITTVNYTGCIWRGECANEEFSSPSTLVTIGGSTTDTNCYAELTTQAGASFRDHGDIADHPLRIDPANGATITLTGTWTTAIVFSEDFHLSNLQIQATGATYSRAVLAYGTGAKILIDNCLITGKSASGYPPVILFGNDIIRNSLVVQLLSGAGQIIALNSTAKAYNCTFVAPTGITAPTYAIKGAYSSSTVRNCAIFGAAALYTGNAPNFTTCANDIASPPSGVTQVAYNNNAFVDTTADWRPKTGSELIDNGTTDETNAHYDIIGTHRGETAWDIGCWEGGVGEEAPTYTGSGGGAVPSATASASGTYTVPVYTGTGAASVPGPTASATGTFTAPTYTGFGSAAVPDLTASAAGTYTVPIYTGSGSPSVGQPTVSASGTFTAPTYTGSGSVSVPQATASASGTFTAPIYAGTGSLSVSTLTVSASGTYTVPVYTGSGSAMAGSPTVSASGTFAAPIIYTGAGSASVPNLAVSASGTFAVPIYTGSGSAQVGNITVSASGTFAVPVYSGSGGAILGQRIGAANFAFL